MRIPGIILLAVIGLGMNHFCPADIITTNFVYDFSSGDQDGSPATGANPFVTANPYVARANTEILESDSGIEFGQAVVYGHITPPLGTLTTYQTFSFTTNGPGRFMNIEQINFVYDMKGLIAGSPIFTGTLRVDVLASIDGFATAGINLGTATLVKSGAAKPPAQNVSINVTNPLLQDFNGQIDFRMAFSDSLTVIDNDSAHTIDNVSVTVSGVPEPATAGFGLALLCGLFCHRRRTNGCG